MKKIAFLLAGLSVASASYAKEVLPVAEPVVEPVVVEEKVEVKSAPVLRLTSVGQYLEIDNTSGAEDIGEKVHFGNKVGLALGDNWTIDLMARKTWSASTDEWTDSEGEVHGDGMNSKGHRIDLGAMRHFENFAVGFKWRGEQDGDKFYIPFNYNIGMFSGWFTPAYKFYDDGHSDSYYLEAMPIVAKYGPVALGYYFEGEKFTGENDDHFYDHQVRLMADLFATDRFRLGAEYWYQFAYEKQNEEQGKPTEKYENNKHTGVIRAAYDVTENLTVDGYYRYDFNQYDEFENITKDDDYYGEFYVGWTYNF